MSLKLMLPLLISLAFVALAAATLRAEEVSTDRARKFIADHEAKLRPLDIAANEAWWRANISGNDEDFKKKELAQNKIDAVLSDPAVFKELKEIKDAGGITD